MRRQQHRLSNLEALYCKWSGGVMELGKLRCHRSTSDWLILLLAIGFGMLWLAWGVHHYLLCFWSTDRLFWPIFLIHCDFAFFSVLPHWVRCHVPSKAVCEETGWRSDWESIWISGSGSTWCLCWPEWWIGYPIGQQAGDHFSYF